MNKEKEIETVTLMVRRYCRGVHGTRGEVLCPACNALLEYARQRRDRCPHGDNKPFCSNCPIHCYKPEMRQQMRAVMHSQHLAARSFRIKRSYRPAFLSQKFL